MIERGMQWLTGAKHSMYGLAVTRMILGFIVASQLWSTGRTGTTRGERCRWTALVRNSKEWPAFLGLFREVGGVVNLQRQTLADLPEVEGLQMAARYLPSSATLGLGGDWYDVYVLDDAKIGLVVGDVSGHGIDAIADMTEFRTTVSTLLRTNQELSQIAEMSTSLLRGDHFGEVRFATAGLMVYDPAEHSLSYVRAGHPPMLVREPGGEVVVLERGGGGPLGITDTGIEVQIVGVEPGSVIVAYTDGLIERRDESIDTGLDRLRRALAECAPEDLWQGAEAIADTLIERCLGDRQTADDAALLVVVVQ